MTKQELLDKADEYKNIIDKNRPFNSEQLAEVDHYFRIGFTYSSNSIEGNSLSISETKILLEDGNTVGNRPMNDYFEAIGQAEAYDYMLSSARSDKLDITEVMIKRLHYLYYNKLDSKEAGQYRTIQSNIPDTEYFPPIPEDVPRLMEHFINQMESSKRFMHPIEFAALCHKRLVDIQPFKEGNGRIARLFMNLILVNAGYEITSIPPVLHNEYRNALMASQNKNNLDIDTFIKFIAECVIEAEKDYCRLLQIKQRYFLI